MEDLKEKKDSIQHNLLSVFLTKCICYQVKCPQKKLTIHDTTSVLFIKFIDTYMYRHKCTHIWDAHEHSCMHVYTHTHTHTHTHLHTHTCYHTFKLKQTTPPQKNHNYTNMCTHPNIHTYKKENRQLETRSECLCIFLSIQVHYSLTTIFSLAHLEFNMRGYGNILFYSVEGSLKWITQRTHCAGTKVGPVKLYFRISWFTQHYKGCTLIDAAQPEIVFSPNWKPESAACTQKGRDLSLNNISLADKSTLLIWQTNQRERPISSSLKCASKCPNKCLKTRNCPVTVCCARFQAHAWQLTSLE